ncbi:MAG TPA: enoyl-CoA hydratase-related protein, partial [Chthoniobacterales bacterium]
MVTLRWVDGTIALITLEDRATKNRFSAALLDGLERAFFQAETNPDTRVVMITGYENYFCCGGTKEELLLLASGQARFTDFSFYDRLLRCECPVVAAMQGHAIGG